MTDEELSALLGEDFIARRAEQQGSVQPEAESSEQPAETPAEAVPPAAEQPAEQPAEDPFTPEFADLFANRVLPPRREPEPEPLPEQPEPDAEAVFVQTAAAAEAALATPKQKKGLLTLLIVITALLMGFAVFCIVWDVAHGTTSGGGYRAGDIVQVELIQHDKPQIDNTIADENGFYTVEGIAENVMPSIVQIYTYQKGESMGTGSGIILSADGYIATNAHVVKDADSYSVRLFDAANSDTPYDAVLVGHDSKTDLAVLKISAVSLTPAQLGNSDQVQLGEKVCALGNPAGLSGSITTGIISGMHRQLRAKSTNFEMDCFQTDAAISPGNSGGALVNLCGQVIGITSSKYKSSALFGGSYEGLGFAITINEALPIIQELMEKGYVSGRVRIGIQFYENDIAHENAESNKQTLPKGLDGIGIQVVSISDDSDLKKTTLKEGDWILAMNGKEVSDYDSVNAAIAGLGAGDLVHCRCASIQENGTLKTFEIDFRLLEDQSGEY